MFGRRGHNSTGLGIDDRGSSRRSLADVKGMDGRRGMKSMGLLCRGRRRSFRRCALRSDLVVARFVRKEGQRGYCGAEIISRLDGMECTAYMAR